MKKGFTLCLAASLVCLLSLRRFSIIAKKGRRGKKKRFLRCLLSYVILLCRAFFLCLFLEPFFYAFNTHLILLQMHAGTVQLRRIAKKYKRKIVFVLGYN